MRIATLVVTALPPWYTLVGFPSALEGPWLEAGTKRLVLSVLPTTALIADISKLLEELKDKAVLVRDAQELQEYLLKFPRIIDVLAEAVRTVKEHFPEAKLLLGMYRDPEAEDWYPLLCVRLKAYDENFMDRLETAEAKFIGRLTETEGWLQLTTDFGDPEKENVF